MINDEQIQALKAAAESQIGILENIAGYEPEDIDGDDVELRFETEDGLDTGCNVSLVEQCQKSADVIRSMLAAWEADKALIAEQEKRIESEIERANREHHRGFMMACGHLKEQHENVHYADAAEMEIAALRQRIAKLEARALTVKLPDNTPCPSAPEIIWLQTNGDDSDESKWPENGNDVCWYWEKIFKNDTLYVRADLVVGGE